jgi:hypothetical protein
MTIKMRDGPFKEPRTYSPRELQRRHLDTLERLLEMTEARLRTAVQLGRKTDFLMAQVSAIEWAWVNLGGGHREEKH